MLVVVPSCKKYSEKNHEDVGEAADVCEKRDYVVDVAWPYYFGVGQSHFKAVEVILSIFIRNWGECQIFILEGVLLHPRVHERLVYSWWLVDVDWHDWSVFFRLLKWFLNVQLLNDFGLNLHRIVIISEIKVLFLCKNDKVGILELLKLANLICLLLIAVIFLQTIEQRETNL